MNKPDGIILTVIDTINKCKSTDSVLVIEDRTIPGIRGFESIGTYMYKKNDSVGRILTNSGTNYILEWTTSKWKHRFDARNLNIDVTSEGRYYIKVTNLLNGCLNQDSVDVLENKTSPQFSIFNTTTKMPGEYGTIFILGVSRRSIPLSYYIDTFLFNGNSISNQIRD